MALVLLALFLVWLLVLDIATLSEIFAGGNGMSIPAIVKMGGLLALASVLLVMAFHPLARLIVKSRMPARSMDLPQRALLEMVPSPIFFLDDEARIEDANSAFIRALGQTAAAVIGKSIYDFIPEEKQEEVYQGLLKTVSGENNDLGCTITTRNGPRMFSIRAEPYKGHNSNDVHLIALAKDISDQVLVGETLNNKYNSLHLATIQTVETIASIVELRDPYLRGHHSRVGQIAKELAQQLGLSDEDVEGVELAARVHDVGTLQIPFEILIKPGDLSQAESEILRQHCNAGYEILKKIDFPWPIADIVLQHHENFDGSGYPNGVRGSDISIGARILSAADAYDALVSDRPFRAAVSRNEALQRLMKMSGQQHDPAVLSALSKYVQQG
jgi:PAS domain S-box-containing protein/putative nucleotidyltransferase with HDIG domain